MSRPGFTQVRTLLLCGCAAIAMAPAWAKAEPVRPVAFSIPAQDLGVSLNQFARQSDHLIVFSTDIAAGKPAPAVQGELAPEQALAMLLEGTGLTWRRQGDAYVVQAESADPQSGSAAGGGAEVEALIVTAQKREENIQDVPIAISAFSAKALEEQKIEGGFDLLKAIPNVTFSKNNFSGYNFSIRGIGTKAISVATDPGVAVEFNSTALIRNRLFEQEYFDIERVEVLRGPQGTLHGRNATAGVINVISAKPKFGEFEGWLKGEVGNYHSKRLSAMVNVPLIEEKVAIRFAGSLTNRDGFDFNDTTKQAVNGRDLWSSRVTLGFQPTDRIHADLIWERFSEDDNRSRTGKQLCHRDPGNSLIDAFPDMSDVAKGHLSQGCMPGSLYDPAAFGTPNGLSIPFIQLLSDSNSVFLGQTCPNCAWTTAILEDVDPYGGLMQSSDLRVINSVRDPKYRAKTDVVELNFDYDLTPSLAFTSQTGYVKDQIYSFQDYNRFTTVPIFTDSSTLPFFGNMDSPFMSMTAGGIYCDPQIGCADSIAGFDISQAKSTQFSQEFRLQSAFEGPLNFSLGANYTRYRTIEDYYVMYNLISLLAQMGGGVQIFNGSADITECISRTGFVPGVGNINNGWVTIGEPGSEGCIYIDPNPVESINGEGHNYFRSKNPYTLKSVAAFGELYWEISPALKVTAGLRYTDDHKTFTPVPSQVLLSSGLLQSGTVDRGYPELPDIKQHWGEFTGRLGVDWTPDLSFTDQTMLYASYSRGYKGGGANPPGIGFNTEPVIIFGVEFPPLTQTLSYPAIFEPEFVNAFEVGTKNTLLGGGLILNAGAFYYDYKDYQVSQIKDRTAVNENFNATVWGLELEAVFHPTANMRFNGAFGYQDTEIAGGERSIDVMNRTQGDPDLVVLKPYVLTPSNCVVPRQALVDFIELNGGTSNVALPETFNTICGGVQAQPLNPFGGPNGGAGVYAELGGNELPNAPHWTISLGGQYTFEMMPGWRGTIRADGYWQSQSWARVYNAVNDKLHGWYNANLSLWVENDDGLKIELYAKNLLDKTPITDAFLNSDDTALTTNVFVLDPRLIGLSIRKEF